MERRLAKYTSKQGWVIDPSAPPILYIWGPPNSVMSLDDVETMDRAFGEIFSGRQDPTVAVANVAQTLPPADVRRALMKMMERRKDLVAQAGGPTVMIVKSSMARGLLTAINWVIPLPHRQYVVADPVAAADKAEELIADFGVALNNETRAMLNWIRSDRHYPAGS